jgi:two-component system, OmpR family, response regulator
MFPAMQKPATGRKRQRILIVEDNEDLLDLFSYQLEARGCDLRVAKDGPTAIAIATEFQPDLILLDLILPGINGYDVARILRQKGLKSKIVAVTAMAVPRHAKSTSDIDEFIIKPLFGAAIDALCEELDAKDIRKPGP